jgi:hypothetical protein
MVRAPERPSCQARTPSAVRDSWVPITEVDLTRAVRACSVECSAVRRAGREAGAEAVCSSFADRSEEPEDVQAASPASAAAVVSRTVVLFMRPPGADALLAR